MHSLRIILAAGACALALGAQADGLKIKPGLWETTTKINNPFTGETTETNTECVEQDTFDPADMMKDAQGCTLTKNEVKGDALNFAMECSQQGAQSSMTGTYRTKGDEGSGHMDMTINAGGMNMEMNMAWTSKRVGDC